MTRTLVGSLGLIAHARSPHHHNSHGHDPARSESAHAPLLASLRTALGPDRASAEPLELSLYARDAGVTPGRAAAVC